MKKTNGMKYDAALICRGSFPATLEETDEPCTVEVTVYRLNAVAVTAFLLDGPETSPRRSVTASAGQSCIAPAARGTP